MKACLFFWICVLLFEVAWADFTPADDDCLKQTNELLKELKLGSVGNPVSDKFKSKQCIDISENLEKLQQIERDRKNAAVTCPLGTITNGVTAGCYTRDELAQIKAARTIAQQTKDLARPELNQFGKQFEDTITKIHKLALSRSTKLTPAQENQLSLDYAANYNQLKAVFPSILFPKNVAMNIRLDELNEANTRSVCLLEKNGQSTSTNFKPDVLIELSANNRISRVSVDDGVKSGVTIRFNQQCQITQYNRDGETVNSDCLNEKGRRSEVFKELCKSKFSSPAPSNSEPLKKRNGAPART